VVEPPDGISWLSFVEASCGGVDERGLQNLTSLPVCFRKKTNLCF